MTYSGCQALGLLHSGLWVSGALTAGQSGPSSHASWTQRWGLEAGVLGPLLAQVPERLWWQSEAAAPGLPLNNTLSAYVHRLPILQRSQNAFHLVSVLQVLLSVFYGNKTKI